MIKDSVISAIELLSWAQDAHAKDISCQLNSSLETIKEGLNSHSPSIAARFKILENAVQQAQDTIEFSLKGVKKIVETEDQPHRDDLGRLDQGLEQTRRAEGVKGEADDQQAAACARQYYPPN